MYILCNKKVQERKAIVLTDVKLVLVCVKDPQTFSSWNEKKGKAPVIKRFFIACKFGDRAFIRTWFCVDQHYKNVI